MISRAVYRPTGRGVGSVFGSVYSLTLPKDGLLSHIKNVDGVMTDTIGLSASDYLLVDESVRNVFFIDASTLRPAADAYAQALASPLINVDTMLGSADKEKVLLYTEGTSRYILNKALRYLGLPQVDPTVADRYTNTDHYTGLENYT